MRCGRILLSSNERDPRSPPAAEWNTAAMLKTYISTHALPEEPTGNLSDSLVSSQMTTCAIMGYQFNISESNMNPCTRTPNTSMTGLHDFLLLLLGPNTDLPF